ncbi:MAG: lysine biosynthesis protein LysX [Phycisphaerales bacterium]
MLHTRIRLEERMLLDEFERRGAGVALLHADELVLDLTGDAPPPVPPGCVVLDRCLSHTKALAILHVLEAQGAVCINRPGVVETCGDKLRTTVALAGAGVASPRTIAAFSAEQAVEAGEALGYPLVLKPTVGSWGRMVSRINDRDALEAVVEHKMTLGGIHHGVVYLQEFVRKPGRDIRAFVIGDRVVAAIGRASAHWITNTARGATTHAVPVTDEINDLCVRAARAVGGGDGGWVLAIDLLEHPERGLMVNEVNSTMEFRNSVAPTGVDIPGLLVELALERARGVVPGAACAPVGGAA